MPFEVTQRCLNLFIKIIQKKALICFILSMKGERINNNSNHQNLV